MCVCAGTRFFSNGRLGEVFRNQIIFAILSGDATAAEITHCTFNSTTITDNIILISLNPLRQG